MAAKSSKSTNIEQLTSSFFSILDELIAVVNDIEDTEKLREMLKARTSELYQLKKNRYERTCFSDHVVQHRHQFCETCTKYQDEKSCSAKILDSDLPEKIMRPKLSNDKCSIVYTHCHQYRKSKKIKDTK